ncbi:MAG: 30S ribosomal protein S16 [Prevotellaceae bacterium]|jgi:small subunit ribosomal protein S16|nr:30S ribosomal protein S16 [Prevotellaceae bacterium]
MATKIRLQRHGRKGYAYYHIVIADSRAPRDGRFIERLGSYNPNTHPATIDLNFERALYWIQTGAQPTDTVRNILSKEGVLLKKHLLGGVKKGAFDEATLEQKFAAWQTSKTQQTDEIIARTEAKKAAQLKERLDIEREIHKAKAAELAKQQAAKVAAAVAAESVNEPVEETPQENELPTEAEAVEVPAAE